jgi:hypothetical protein
MKSILTGALLVAAVAVVGCRSEYKGQILVHQAFTAKVSKGSNKVDAGTHDARLRIDQRNNKAVLEISKSGRNNNPHVTFNLRGTRLPRNGAIRLTGAQSGQNFDVIGEIRTIEERTRTRRDYQSCETYVREQYCWRDQNGRTVCEWRTRRVMGRQEIEYYDEITTSDLSLDLVAPEQTILAEVDGHDTYSRRVVTYEGQCW